MHLGVLTTSYPRWPGDPAGSFVAEHVAWLRRQGHRVDVIAAGDPDVSSDLETDPGLRVARVDSALFFRGGAPEAFASQRAAWSHAACFAAGVGARVLRWAHSWDAVIAHWLIPCGVLGALLTPGKPLVAVAHSGDVHLSVRAGLAGMVAAILRARDARVVFVTQQLRELFVGHTPSRWLRAQIDARSTVRSMGVDVERFARLERVTNPAPVVLFLGRLVPVKGVDTLIDAAAEWRSGARLIIAGNGPDRERLVARAQRLAHVELVGEVDTFERDRLLARSDVLVLPSTRVERSRTEGMPLAVLEAMAAGVPVVASRVGGLAELPESTIWTVEPDDPIALAKAVDGVLEDPVCRAAQTHAARQLARDRDWSVVGPTLLPR